MKKILYIVSTLQKSGPISQLFNIISNLDRSVFEPCVLTLSPEPVDSRWSDFERIGIELRSLRLSRLSGLLFAKGSVQKVIQDIKPSLIHTQGIRADSIISSIRRDMPWIMTSRNFPEDDYPTKFGRFKGRIMVYQHVRAMRKCSHVVACSKTISKKLALIDVASTPIQNGVQFYTVKQSEEIIMDFEHPVFISVGSLIPRKNMSFLISAFNCYKKSHQGSLVILGDGFEMERLKEEAKGGVHFMGSVNNVKDFLHNSDMFLSASLSEGLPNTVLEALSCGVPCLLSDIESHDEIRTEYSLACQTFSLQAGTEKLAEQMVDFIRLITEDSKKEAKEVVEKLFSAEKMSKNYQNFYQQVLSENV